MSTTEKQLRVRINKDGVTCAPECKAIVETFTPVRLVLIAREATNANVLVVWDAEHEPGCIEFYGLAPQQELAVVQFVLDEARRMRAVDVTADAFLQRWHLDDAGITELLVEAMVQDASAFTWTADDSFHVGMCIESIAARCVLGSTDGRHTMDMSGLLAVTMGQPRFDFNEPPLPGGGCAKIVEFHVSDRFAPQSKQVALAVIARMDDRVKSLWIAAVVKASHEIMSGNIKALALAYHAYINNRGDMTMLPFREIMTSGICAGLLTIAREQLGEEVPDDEAAKATDDEAAKATALSDTVEQSQGTPAGSTGLGVNKQPIQAD